MVVGKFIAIAHKSKDALPSLSQAPLMIEFSISNHSLHRKTVTGMAADDDRVRVKLGDLSATFKPLVDSQNTMSDNCCVSAISQTLSCC